MTALNLVNDFKRALSEGEHNLDSDTIRVALTNTAPTVSQTAFAPGSDHPPPASANGYTAGGETIANTSVSLAGGVATFDGDDVQFQADGGALGPFRYAVIYNDTHASDALIGWLDRGESITLQDQETLDIAWHADGITQLD